MTLKTSLIITGDSSVAKAAVEELTAAVKTAGAASTTTAADVAKLDKAQTDTAASAKAAGAAEREAAAGVGELERELKAAQAALAAQGAELNAARQQASGFEAAQIKAASGADALAQELKATQAALAAQGAELNASRAALSSLDQSQAATAASARAAAIAQREGATALAAVRGELSSVIAENGRLSAELREQQAALGAVRGDYAQVVASVGALEKELAAARTEIDRLNAALQSGGKAVNDNTKALGDNVRSAGTVKAGYQQLGFQMQDVGIQLSMGTDLMRVMAMQGGQLATAIDMIGMKGAGGRVASFFAGPWGAVILTAGAVLAPFVAELFSAAEAEEAATTGANGLATAQTALADVFDLTTGALKRQNEQMVLNARLTAINLRNEALQKERSSREVFETAGDPSTLSKVAGYGSILAPGGLRTGLELLRGNTQVRNLGRLLQETDRMPAGAARTKRFDELLQISNDIDYSGSAVSRKDAQQAIKDRADARANLKIADEMDRSLDTGVLSASLRREGTKKREPKAASTAARDEFGRDAADKIAGIVGQFGDAPDVIEKTNAKVRELDDLIEDLGRRKPPGFKDLIASAEAAKVTVRDGLIATVAEAFDRPKTLAEKADAALGDLDAVIADLSAKKPVDWEKSVDAARKAQGVIKTALNEPIAEYLRQSDEQSQVQNALIGGRTQEAEALQIILDLERRRGPLSQEQRDAVAATVALRRDEAAALERVQRRQSVYLDQLHEMRDAIEDSVQALVRLDLKALIATPAKLVEAYQQAQGRQLFEGLFGDSFAELERALTEGPVDKASRRMAGGMDTATAAVEKLGKAAIGAATEIVTGAPADPDTITVTGTRRLPTDVDSITREALGGVATDIADLFGSRAFAEKIGAQIGAAGAEALQGAAAGRSVATLADQLGFGKSIDSTGAQIGGALGSIVGGPIGSIVGAIAGGLIGSAFDGPTRSGYSSIGTDANGNAVSAISGGRNSEGRQRESLTYADAVLDGLARIASGLGGRLGSGLDLGTIGTQGDKYVFDPDGAGSAAGTKFDTLEKAVEAALANAVSKGAVTGLSDAVRKALASSPDVDKALAEASKVKALETLIGGVGGQLQAMLAEFDNEAAERVRLAKSYGLDLLAVEKKNATDRAQLLDDIMKERVGSLQSLLDDMRYGDLFEGDATERRSQILSEIEDARQDATAGVDGAADRLAELYRLLLSTTRENFGTAGPQLTDDRGLVQSGAADVIKRETDRLTAAAGQQKATTDAVVAGNRLLDEMADQIATTNTRLGSIEDLLSRGSLPALTIDPRGLTARTPE